nr:efflux RND transporter periplasmic adaptor subunit [Cypionkella sp.]
MTVPATPGVRKMWRQAVTLAVTLVVVGGAGAVGLTGYAMIADTGDLATGSTAPVTPVGVMEVTPADGYTVTRRFIGRVEAAAQTDLGFELGGRVTEVLVDEG